MSEAGKALCAETGKATSLKLYGVTNPSMTERSKQKVKDTKLKRYGDPFYRNKEKAEKTCLERYGAKNGGGSAQSIARNKETCKKKYGVDCVFQLSSVKERIKKTNLERYGVEVSSQSKEVRQKVKQTWVQRYGVEEILSIVGPKHARTNASKIIETKRARGTFTKSKIQDEAFRWLSSRFSDLVPEHRDETRYPFACDFYLPSADLFIEIQGMWTHGKHPFDKSSKEDDLTQRN